MPSKVKIVFACLTCLVIGYFIGREHLKYEMRTAMQDAFEQLRSGISTARDGVGGPAGKAETPTPRSEQPLAVALLQKDFSPKDIHDGKFDEEVTFTLTFKNNTGKEIRAFDGILQFTDLLDNNIIASKVEINERIAQGSELSWDGALDYNQFMSDHQRLRAEPRENLKVTFHAGKVLFSDGTVKEYK